MLRRQLIIVAERLGGCRRHGRALGGWPWWTRESNQYGERERCASLVRSMARFHEMSPDFGRIYTLIVAEKKITAPAILYVA